MSEIIFGIHPVQEALRNGRTFERLYVNQKRKGKAITAILALAKAHHIEIRFEAWERLTTRAGGKTTHQGIVGIIPSFSYTSLEELLFRSQQFDEPAFFLILDQIQDPHNLGAILRSAECAGVHGVVIPKRKSAEVTPTVTKVSAGATTYLPVCRVSNIAASIEGLQRQNIWVIGTSATAKQRYTQADFTLPVAIVIGNEEKGIRRLVAEKCDLMVSIPLYGEISSLNASVSSALLLFEGRRQRSL